MTAPRKINLIDRPARAWLRDFQINRLAEEQSSKVDFLLSPRDRGDVGSPLAVDQVFRSNAAIWKQIIDRTLYYGSYLILDGFLLSEWLPRSPGLFFTREGTEAREDAQDQIISIKDGIVLYNPHGKRSMLDGGIGNIRLKPQRVDGKEYFFVSASSNGVAHEGFPVAVPQDLYSQYLKRIIEMGALQSSLIGRLKFVPTDLAPIYRGYRHVPQLYLMVEEIRPATHEPMGTDFGSSSLATVTVAASFEGEFENQKGIFASFVTFFPGEKGSFERAVNWMENEYIGKMYKGKVITDFDQQESHFPDAVFALDKVMTRTLSKQELEGIRRVVRDPSRFIEHQRQVTLIVNEGEVYMSGSSKYNISGGNQGAVGDNAQARDFTQVSANQSQNFNLETLARELRLLHEAARERAAGTGQSDAVHEIAEAESAAIHGDEGRVREHLARAGKWALDVARDVGVELAAEFIKQSIKGTP